MDNNEEQNFVFGADDHQPDFHHDANDRRLEKLSQKVTILSILIPCIIGILIVFIYLDIKNKVVQVHTTGSSEVNKISSEFSKTISEIKQKNSDIEKNLNTKTGNLEKSLSRLNKSIKKAEKNISFLTSSKINKKAVNNEIATLKKETEALKTSITELTSQSTKLVKIANELNKRLGDVAVLKSEVERLEIDLAYLKDNIIEKSELSNELKKQKIFYQLELKELSDTVNKKIDSMKRVNQNTSGSSKVPEVKLPSENG